MVNYQKTEECYIRENYKYEKPPDYIGEQNWLKKVTNPHTGTFYKLSDLPIEWRKIRKINHIQSSMQIK